MDHLTSPNPELERLRRQTREGQAYWGGTGPAGQTCGACVWWRFGEHHHRRAYCHKYAAMTGKRSVPAVPGGALACKYFEKRGEKT